MFRIMIVLFIMMSVVCAQFQAGTISAGSLFNYSSIDGGGENSDPQAAMTIGPQAYSYFSLTVKPTISYFIINNVSADIIFSRTSRSDEDYDLAMMFYGPGASIYMSGFYAGGGYVIMDQQSSSDNYESTNKSNFVEVHGGLLHKLSENVYLDLNASYLMGVGDEVSEYSGDGYNETNEDPNEATVLNFSIGVKGFFNL